MDEVKRGSIYYIINENPDAKSPHEQAGTRPAVVISNDIGNLYAPVVIVALLTAKKKKFLPTHVKTEATGKESTILCEQIITISKDRLLGYVCSLSQEELSRVDEAILISLDLHQKGAIS